MRVLLFTVAVLFIPTFTFASIPEFPMAFWGSATIDDTPAPTGTTIRAYYGTSLAAVVTLQENGVYGYTEPTKQKLVVAAGENSITFTMQAPGYNNGIETAGVTPVTHNQFATGVTLQKDLSFSLSTPPSSTGGGGGGGGGSSNKKSGGSSSSNEDDSSNETPDEQVLGAATSTDTTITLQKQLIVILTQLISLLKLKLELAQGVSV